MIDSHCHLADDAFLNDREAVIARGREAGLTHLLCILAADNPVELERARVLAAVWNGIRFAAGVHPHQAGGFAGREGEAASVVRAAVEHRSDARAIGEIGLDYHYDFAPRPVQQQLFRVQIRLARELDLPVIIHTRDAEDDTLAILREESSGRLRGVLHCFTGSRHLADAALELGLHISFAGIVTFPKAANLREVAAAVPADRLLCETDSPYLAPTPYRGKRNEPAWVVRVAEELAAARGEDVTQLGNTIDVNFRSLFRP